VLAGDASSPTHIGVDLPSAAKGAFGAVARDEHRVVPWASGHIVRSQVMHGYTCIAKEPVMLAIRLPVDIEERLNRLTLETGRTKTALAREAILEHLDDLEDFYLAQSRARKNRKLIPLDDVERDLGMAN
jgi:RHH-type rel operon transcriptional repressor/antitoxin RelB